MADPFVAALCDRVKDSASRGTPLRVRGGGTKDFYGEAARGEPLEMAACTGIVAYEPRELVLTVRAGTSVQEVEDTLAGERQMLPFEPPHFGRNATLGGCRTDRFQKSLRLVLPQGHRGPKRPARGVRMGPLCRAG